MTVDLTLAKAHCRVTSSSEDTIITQYMNAAISFVENYTYKKLSSGTVTQTFSAFPGVTDSNEPEYFVLLWGPDPSGVTISYVDENGDDQEITTAQLVGNKLYVPLDGEWPAIQENSIITIDYTAGYSSVPAALDSAVLLLTGEYYDNRTASMASSAVTDAVSSLCEPYRLPVLR